MAAPRGPFCDQTRTERTAGRLDECLLERDDIEAAGSARPTRDAGSAADARLDEPFEEELAERLVVAVQLSVAWRSRPGERRHRGVPARRTVARRRRARTGPRPRWPQARMRPRSRARRRRTPRRCSVHRRRRRGTDVASPTGSAPATGRGSCGERPHRPSAGASGDRRHIRATTSPWPVVRTATRSRAGPSAISVRRSAADARGRIVW